MSLHYVSPASLSEALSFLAEHGPDSIILAGGMSPRRHRDRAASKGTKIGLLMQRSAGYGDLFLQFEHAYYGSPLVMKVPKEQFEEAERDLKALMLHVGLEQKKDNAGRP